jgi:hypothetical protein
MRDFSDSFGSLTMAAKTAAKAALKGKNQLRKKKVRTNTSFNRPKTLSLPRSPKVRVNIYPQDKINDDSM